MRDTYHLSPGESLSAQRGKRRRATILIFTIGVLTLLALVGVGLLASVRAQRSKVINDRSGVTPSKLIDGVAQAVQGRLRDDLWSGSGAASKYLNGSATAVPGDAREVNEPFDAPGPYDRWLASTVPYRFDPNTDPLVTGDDYLKWHHVSYLGADLLRTGDLYNWPDNSLTPAAGDPTTFNAAIANNDAKLTDVPVSILPPMNYDPGLYPFGAAPQNAQPPAVPGQPANTPIPGSTTNVTIELARRIWQTRVDAVSPGWTATHRFPYFDTNQDGIVDLYDADGDGVPDSPISFVLPYSGNRVDGPREVYAVVRVVDNNSMVNLSTAGARDSNNNGTGNGTDPGDIFWPVTGTPNPDREFRGRRPWEICLDAAKFVAPGASDVSVALDSDIVNPPIQQLLGYRFTGNATATATFGGSYYNDVLRRLLVGGSWRAADAYGLFRATDELALRGRNGLSTYVGGGSGWRSDAELSLPATLGGRWRRFAAAEAYGANGWIALLDSETVDRVTAFGADVPALRRPLLTSVGRVCDRFTDPAVVVPASASNPPAISGLFSKGVTIPVEPMRMYYDLGMPLEGQVLQEKIDLNQTYVLDPYSGAPPGLAVKIPLIDANSTARAIYLGNLMWAFMNAGNGGGLQVMTDPTPPGTVVSAAKLAAQLAANVMDYRDGSGDPEPTVIESNPGGPLATPVAGLEAQPFITEVFAKCVITDSGDTSLSRYAVEIWNPYNYQMTGYELRVEGATAPNFVPLLPIAGGQRLVLLSVPSAQFTLETGIGFSSGVQDDAATQTLISQISFNDSGQMQPRRVYLIRNDTIVSGTPTKWVCDGFIMNRVECVNGSWQPAVQPVIPGDPPVTVRNFFQRQEVDPTSPNPFPGNVNWKFTVGRSHVEHPAIDTDNQTLSTPNDAAMGEVIPSIWTFRDIGLTPVAGNFPDRAFESPIDLSRVLAFGNDCLDLNNPIFAIPNEPVSVPEKLALYQHRVLPGVTQDRDRAIAGRLDFADVLAATPSTTPPTGQLLNFLTCSGTQFDGVDNNGRAGFDEVGEPHTTGVRQTGLINVNTAPVTVLRSVPWMLRVMPLLGNWDFAPAIVAQRENRSVEQMFGANVGPATAAPIAGSPFVTVADLLRASSVRGTPLSSQFDLAMFATAGFSPPPDNSVTMGRDYSPDYDRVYDGAIAAGQDIRSRDLFVSRWANILTTRSDTFTVYVALLDENGRYLRRSRFVIDRSNTAAEDMAGRRPQMPTVVSRTDTDYYDDTR